VIHRNRGRPGQLVIALGGRYICKSRQGRTYHTDRPRDQITSTSKSQSWFVERSSTLNSHFHHVSLPPCQTAMICFCPTSNLPIRSPIRAPIILTTKIGLTGPSAVTNDLSIEFPTSCCRIYPAISHCGENPSARVPSSLYFTDAGYNAS
jgi:hypothetical protein